MRSRIEISERQSRAALFAATTAVLILVLAAVLFAAEPEARGNRGSQDVVTVSAPPTALWHVLFAN